MTNYITSITIGLGLGLMLCATGNKMTSAYAQNSCKDLPDTHQVVLVSGFMGSTWGCVDNRYL